MKIIVNGKNLEVTDAIRDYVEEKINKLEHHFDFVNEVHVFLSVEKNPRIKESQRAEATIHVNGAIVRIEEASDSMYASIDLLEDKIDRSLKRHKTKLLKRSKSERGQSIRRSNFEEAVAQEQADSDDEMEGVFITFEEDVETASAPVK